MGPRIEAMTTFLLSATTGNQRHRMAMIALAAWMTATPAVASEGPTSDAFERALAREYRGLFVETARLLARDSGWIEKARRARRGERVTPERPERWPVPGDRRQLVTDAYARLTAVLSADAHRTVPALSARAQRYYDCWLTRLSARAPSAPTLACRNAFFSALSWVEAAVTPVKTGTRFTRSLTYAYLDYATARADLDDDAGARYFAKKGLAAGEGALVMPETTARWNLLGGSELPQVVRARRRLVAALDEVGRERRPDHAARAQVAFDCWLAATAARRSEARANACRKQFLDGLVALEFRRAIGQ